MSGLTQPIRDPAKFLRMQQLMADDGADQELLFTWVAFCTNLRKGDVLKLQWRDVVNVDGTLRADFTVTEQKTRHLSDFSGALAKMDEFGAAILAYHARLRPSPGRHLFRSRDHRLKHTSKPWCGETVRKFLKRYAAEAGIEENISAHSLRKTFGLWLYRETLDIVLVQCCLGHTNGWSTAATLRYIGYTTDEVNDARASMAAKGLRDPVRLIGQARDAREQKQRKAKRKRKENAPGRRQAVRTTHEHPAKERGVCCPQKKNYGGNTTPQIRACCHRPEDEKA